MPNKTPLQKLEDIILYNKKNPVSKRELMLEINHLKLEEEEGLKAAYLDGTKVNETLLSDQEWFNKTYED